MQVITVTGGRENKEFFKRLDAFDDKDYDLINICLTHSGRYIAFLRHKNPGKSQVVKKTEIKGKI